MKVIAYYIGFALTVIVPLYDPRLTLLEVFTVAPIFIVTVLAIAVGVKVNFVAAGTVVLYCIKKSSTLTALAPFFILMKVLSKSTRTFFVGKMPPVLMTHFPAIGGVVVTMQPVTRFVLPSGLITNLILSEH